MVNSLNDGRDPDGYTVSVRPMYASDLNLVGDWMLEPHVARWWRDGADELTSMRRRLEDRVDTETHMLIVSAGDRPVGWAQWYRWHDYPDEAAAMGARPEEVGMDYAIGDPALVGRGVGRRMIAVVIGHIRSEQPGAGFLVGPDAANLASRAVLERNGFRLVEIRPVATEPTNDPIAIYRLPASRSALTGRS